MIFSNKVYDVLKWVAQILLPATGTLYFALSQIWGLPAGEQVVGTLVALDAFLGALLGLSSKAYVPETDGVLHVDTRSKETYAAVETPTNELVNRGTMRLRVEPIREESVL